MESVAATGDLGIGYRVGIGQGGAFPLDWERILTIPRSHRQTEQIGTYERGQPLEIRGLSNWNNGRRLP